MHCFFLWGFCPYKIFLKGDFMNKTNRFELRLSDREFELIKKIASQRKLTVSRFILSVVIPICCKIENQDSGGGEC